MPLAAMRLRGAGCAKSKSASRNETVERKDGASSLKSDFIQDLDSLAAPKAGAPASASASAGASIRGDEDVGEGGATDSC